jgi:5-formyltetrahydrofolate cyclo-ligase
VQVRFERKALNVGVGPTLLLWFESNDSHRHCGWRFLSLLFVITKAQLRVELRAARRALDATARQRAARALALHVRAMRWLAPGKRIGFYAALPDEIDTLPLIALAQERGCEVYLPRIVSYRARRMRFFAHETGRTRPHRFGMHEPQGFESLDARFLDTIFVPGLAFDVRGARLGLGAGFYDRTLAFRRHRVHWRGPRLVGLAYAFQLVDEVPATATDIHMDLIVTDRGIHELLAHEDRAVDVRSR